MTTIHCVAFLIVIGIFFLFGGEMMTVGGVIGAVLGQISYNIWTDNHWAENMKVK